MADISKTIEILFHGNDQLSSTMRGISSSFSEFDQIATTIAEPFSQIADGVLAADTALAAFAVGGLTFAFVKSKEFGGALIELAKVTDNNAEAMEKARVNAMDLSGVYGESSTEILESTASLIQAGYTLEEAMNLTKASMDLVIAGGLDAARSSEILIATLKGFDAPASEAARLIDILNAVSNKYATDVEQLGIGMSKIAPIAKLMGFSFEETAGLLTPVIEVFRSGDQAAIALKTGLLKLLDDAAPVQEALANLGISQNDLNGKLKSGKDILLEVGQAFRSAEENDKLFLTSQLVGLEQAAKMVTVFDNLSKYTDIVSTALGAAGSAAAEVALRLESADVAVKRLVTGFTNLGIVVGDQFKAAAVSALGGLAEIELALIEGVEAGAFETLFKPLRAFGDEAGELFSDIAKNLPEVLEDIDFSGILKGLDNIKDTIGDLFGGLDLSDPDDLATALQKIADTIAALLKVTDGMIEGFRPLFEVIAQGIDEINSLDEESSKSFGRILASAKLVKEAGSIIAGALFIIQQSGTNISAVYELVLGTIETVWNALQYTFSRVAETVIDAVGIVISANNALLQAVPDVVADLIPGFTGFRDGLNKVTTDIQMFQIAIEEDSAAQFSEMVGGASRVLGAFSGETEVATKGVGSLSKTLDEMPEDKTVTLDIEIGESTDATTEILEGIPDTKNVTINVNDQAVDEFQEKLPDEYGVMVYTNADLESINVVEKEIAEVVPAEMDLELKAKLEKEELERDLEALKIKAELFGEAFKYKAEVDTAEIRAAAEVTQAAFESLNTTLQGSADILVAMSGAYVGAETASQRLFLEQQIREEGERRDTALKLQSDLVEKQLEYYEAKKEAAERGDALVKIDGAGLQPHLEAIMWEILAAIQVRANEEGQAALLGLSI